MTDSPTFVATFNDGTQTRMTVWHDPERKALNLDRGIRLAQHAYRSRKQQEPPLIVAAAFERNGEILASYTASEFADDTAAEPTEGVTPEPAEPTAAPPLPLFGDHTSCPPVSSASHSAESARS
jgi:hypothetical protein